MVHKLYGKQVAGSVSLASPVPDKTNGVQAVPVPDLSSSPVSLSAAGAAREASQMLAQPQQKGGLMYRQQQLAAAAPQQLTFGVKVPAGLSAGKKFVASIPGHGQMLVYVPKGVAAGEVVAIHVPGAAGAPAEARRATAHEHKWMRHKGGKHAALPFRSGVAGYKQDMASEAHAVTFFFSQPSTLKP